ncbi:MAG: ABC transporter ATP-binding protein [Clostridia bacterium]|nr:ABC transporter ATP-binding protein [Candidatus Pelethousia sp.]NCB30079.1 ABC transporter ATP-binding protein [Clostridia bacterium]
MALLRIDHVRRVFNTRLGLKQCIALRDVSFQVCEGEFVAIMGPSGSGKSTLLNIIASLDKASSGDVYLAGRSLKAIPERELSAFRRDNLGFVFQEFNLLDTFTLRDNILLPLVLARMPLAEMEARLVPVARELGIAELLEKFPYEVSGGEKQRAAVARAIITNPKLLLADEPTGALDSRASANLLQQFSALNEKGHTLLMVTHSALAASHAGRVLFIRDGELFNQLYRGEDGNRAFYERIVASLSVLEDGGANA